MIEAFNKFHNIIKQVPSGIAIFSGRDLKVELANDMYLQLVDKTEENFVGYNLMAALPELIGQGIEELLLGVMDTGVPYEAAEMEVKLKRWGKIENGYFNLVYSPLKNEAGEVNSVVVVATEVTGIVKGKQVLSESEKQFRHLVMQSPIAMAILKGRQLTIEMANAAMLKIWRRTLQQVTGNKLEEVFPELDGQRFPDLLRGVYDTGIEVSESEALAYIDSAEGMGKYYVDIVYGPLYGPDGKIDGIIATVVDVTERVEAREKIQESENRYRLAIEAANLGTFEWDFKTSQFFYSQRLLQIFGLPPGEHYKQQDLLNLFHKDDKAMRDAAVQQAMKTGSLTYDARIIWPDGTMHWLQTKGKLIYNEKGEPLRMFGTTLNITEQKLALNDIAEREERFRLLADSMPQHVWTGDDKGNLNYFNKSVYNYSGYTPDRIKTDGWLSIVHPDDKDENVRLWIHSVTTGDDFTFEHRFRRHDGEYRWQLSRALAQKDDTGKIQMWVGTSTDIHDRKMMSDELEKHVATRTYELKRANEELLRSNLQLEQFAYVASHDLQEPLRKIRTFAQMLLETQSDGQKTNKYLGKINSSADRMSALIKDVLEFSRLMQTEDVFAMVDLNEVLQQVSGDYELMIEQKGAVIKSNALPVVKGIPLQLTQLFTNLIGNALKFSATNPVIEITAGVVAGKDITDVANVNTSKKYARLIFKDNGIGFDQKYADKIFTIFQRLNDRSQYIGTGIGLAMCRRIADNHHGYITAHGEVGQGATFTVYLPL